MDHPLVLLFAILLGWSIEKLLDIGIYYNLKKKTVLRSVYTMFILS